MGNVLVCNGADARQPLLNNYRQAGRARGPISGHGYSVTRTYAQVAGTAGHGWHPRGFTTTGTHYSGVCPPCPLGYEPPALELRSDILHTDRHQGSCRPFPRHRHLSGERDGYSPPACRQGDCLSSRRKQVQHLLVAPSTAEVRSSRSPSHAPYSRRSATPEMKKAQVLVLSRACAISSWTPSTASAASEGAGSSLVCSVSGGSSRWAAWPSSSCCLRP